jgi:hypothetical protein
MSGRLVARVAAIKRVQSEWRATVVNVVAWPFAVGVNDHPRDPLVHCGHTVDKANARKLGEAMAAGHRVQVNTGEGAVLTFRPATGVVDEHGRDSELARLHTQRGEHDGWVLTDDQVHGLGDALLAGVRSDGGR